MFSPGLCVVLIVWLCGLFQGISATIECANALANTACFGGECLCKIGYKANADSTACEVVTAYKSCTVNEDCGLGTCTSSLCTCGSDFVSGERCELHSDPFVLIPPSSRGVMAARLSIGSVLLLSALAALVLRL